MLNVSGFILDGGVHNAALLRVVLPDLPQTIISTATLHRSHLPPHDTVMALALPPSSAARKPYGRDFGDTARIPVASGQSAPTGTIAMSWAAPDTALPNGRLKFDVTCLNGKVAIEFVDNVVSVRTYPATGSSAKEESFEGPPTGIAVEVDMFGKALRGTNDAVQYGSPRDALWDLAVIQALVSSHSREINLSNLTGQ